MSYQQPPPPPGPAASATPSGSAAASGGSYQQPRGYYPPPPNSGKPSRSWFWGSWGWSFSCGYGLGIIPAIVALSLAPGAKREIAAVAGSPRRRRIHQGWGDSAAG